MNFKVNSTLKKADLHHCGAHVDIFTAAPVVMKLFLPSESLVFPQFVSSFLIKPEGIIWLRRLSTCDRPVVIDHLIDLTSVVLTVSLHVL